MQIGEFARICETKISVLRHYDKEGLLVPDYIDRFTGYRYYAKEQITIFVRINALKKAGFSLSEIREILKDTHSDDELLSLFEKKKNEINETLANLEDARKMMLRDQNTVKVRFVENENKITVRSSVIDPNEQRKARGIVEKAIVEQGYQRVSPYAVYGSRMSDLCEIVCEVVKLSDKETDLNENIDLPFENDESVVGKWEIVGEFPVKYDFYSEEFKKDYLYGECVKEIYFLPEGEQYWCYGWTRGKLLIDTGDGSCVNDYTIEKYDGNTYMFVSLKSYEYRHGGQPTTLVLRQIDNKAYTAESIARKDNIDMPFVNDDAVIGKWKVFGFCLNKEAFSPHSCQKDITYFASVEFRPSGEVICKYGEEIISDRNMQEWTKGYILRKWNKCACEYEIREICGREYLIVEWKSGDYRWGGFDTDYYVFVRE
ncbi:MAG: MerR family transcriptional regulator [Ruminococcaceae bacterium]|nr:MerR family transcriptional regulator [Oscillospiraceae bacterium]